VIAASDGTENTIVTRQLHNGISSHEEWRDSAKISSHLNQQTVREVDAACPINCKVPTMMNRKIFAIKDLT